MSTYKDLLMTLSNKGYCTSERQLSELKKELDDIYKSDEYAFLFYRTMENHYLDRNILEDNQICYFAEVYYQINKVSANGMNRNISFFLSVDSKVVKLDFLMSKILDMKLSTNWRGGIKVRGCGMDMGFKIINDLQNTIFIKLSHRQI